MSLYTHNRDKAWENMKSFSNLEWILAEAKETRHHWALYTKSDLYVYIYYSDQHYYLLLIYHMASIFFFQLQDALMALMCFLSKSYQLQHYLSLTGQIVDQLEHTIVSIFPSIFDVWMVFDINWMLLNAKHFNF